jgi:uncharacterized protein (DUF302 family)
MRKLVLGLLLASLSWASAHAATPGALNIADTVVRVPIADNVSMDDAIESMKLRANALNIKLVGHQPMYKELQAMGVESRRIEIFQFCDAGIGWEMIKHDMNFAAYMPCRIVLVEDDKGKGWLVMANMNFFIGAANLPPDLKKQAEKVRDGLNEVIKAGANGEL